MSMRAPNPTAITYTSLDGAYLFFNQRLFGGRLPPCLITMQRHRTANGYFSGGRFETRDGKQITDEIALNPSNFLERTTQEIFSTLVHEMVHLEQHHFGKPSRAGYHNKQWAEMMKAVGLIPSDTGESGGKETGQTMSHSVEKRGRFERTCAELMKRRIGSLYVERWRDDETLREKKAASKTRYTCPECRTNAWAKPNVHLICGECPERMEAD
jgi:predicted SprT family Zn-dependent metalloprotease